MCGEQGSMGITIRDGDGVLPTGEVGDGGQTAGASLLAASGGQNAASLVSPEGYVIHRQSPLRDSRACISCTCLGSSFLRDFGDGGALVSSIRGRFVLEGLSGLSGEAGEGEGDKGELLAEWASSGDHRNEAGLVCTERGPGSLEGLGESSWMEGDGCGHTMSVLSQGSSESALRLRGREWRGMDSWAMSSIREREGQAGDRGTAEGRVYNPG